MADRNPNSRKENYNSPEYYRVKRVEFAHGQNRSMPPKNTVDYGGQGNYQGRDYEQNIGYRKHYDDLGGDNDSRYETTAWSNREEQRYRHDHGPHKGKGPRSYQRSDERILEDVSDRLRDDPYVDASEIAVSVEKGEVMLNGTVSDKETKRRVEDICDDVSGVKQVENRIRIKGPFYPST